MLVFVFAAKVRLFLIGCTFLLLFCDFSKPGLTLRCPISIVIMGLCRTVEPR